MAKVYIVDDESGIVEWLRAIVESVGLTPVSFENPVEFARCYRPDPSEPACGVFDLRMPRLSGIDLLHNLRQRGDHLPVILLSAHGEVATAVEAMKAGASDFLQKPCGTQTIIDAVHHALAQAEAVNIKEERARSAKESMARLTAKEREVLDAVVAGHSNKVIAIDLGISDKAVENRRARLMHKLGAGSVADLVRMVCEVEVE